MNERHFAAPFPYVHGGSRSWPIFPETLPGISKVTFTAKNRDRILAQGNSLSFSGFTVSITDDNKLQITSEAGNPKISFELEMTVRCADGSTESQKLKVRPAPPDRPLSYVADFGDDMISIFEIPGTAFYKEIEKADFDQYFRRVQAQGISRLIMWLSPFPYIPDPANYAPQDWDRHEKQARAVIESDLLDALLKKHKSQTQWGYKKLLLSSRLRKDFGAMLSQSALEHGIKFTVSYRPFEAAVAKFIIAYAFDNNGDFLWDYASIANPTVTYNPEKTCFAHYRTILSKMGHAEAGKIDTIEIPGVQAAAAFIERFRTKGDNLKIIASPFPPMQEDSLVLQRQSDGSFKLVPYGEIHQQVQSRLQVVRGYDIKQNEKGSVIITGLDIPDDCRYIILSNPADAKEALDLSARQPVVLWAKAGNRLGRENIYWVLEDTQEQHKNTRVGGIAADTGCHTDFYATEYSVEYLRSGPERQKLLNKALVIDYGLPWSYEMMDFNSPVMRQCAVAELKTILSYPAFDEIFINTRSHTQLPGYLGDGEEGIKPGSYYRDKKQKYIHLGIDHAYGPIAAADEPRLKSLVADKQAIEQITMSQPGEWKDTCQSPDSPYRWRYTRNQEVAKGVRKLLEDLQEAFPGVRTRVVISERDVAFQNSRDIIDKYSNIEDEEQSVAKYGQLHGLDWYHNLWRRTDHIVAFCEGMALLDLTGLAAEPVFLGIRDLPEQECFAKFVDECIKDMADNHGSSYRGPHSFFLEANQTITREPVEANRRRREQIICHLLSHEKDIKEVVLYESQAWIYAMDISDPDYYGHGFLDRQEEILKSIDEK